MRFFGILLCLAALGLTGYSALTYKAPKIEADIERRTAQTLAALAADGVEVTVDGRHVTLAGPVADGGQRQLIMSAAAAVPGALGPIDRLDRLPPASPYRFVAVKDEAGAVTIEGHAPNAGAKTAIETSARALFGDAAAIEIEVAAGAPGGDWRAAVVSGLDALATLHQGRLSVSDTDILLEGEAATAADVDAVDIFAAALPDGYGWRQEVGVDRQQVEPFTFSVVKGLDGGLHLVGFAPDDETRAALIEEGEAVGGGRPVVADITVADGMPDDEWPSLVQAGISAMKDMEAGRFDVVDNDVSFSSDPSPADAVATESAAAVAAAPTAPAGDQVDAALSPGSDASAAITPELTIDKVEAGVWSIRGVVPDQEARDGLIAALRDQSGVEEVDAELDVAGTTPDEDWLRFAADHMATLDEVSAGRLSVDDYQAHLIGVVETQDDIEAVQAALAAIDPDMTVDLQPIDPRPAASLELTMSPEQGVVLSGALPGELSAGEAFSALGISDHDGTLGGDARGPAEAWRRYLSAIGEALPAFEEIRLSLGGERPEVEGRVHAHADPDAIARRIVLALSDERQPLVDIEAATTAHEDGARRTSPLTGEEEFHRQGYWLPVIAITPDEQTCRERAVDLVDAGEITFLRGEDDIDASAEPTLNALASLALACLENTEMVLEIGGHTDSRGAASLNQELSQARADAVLNALVARGVDADALIAVGYGDSRPVADNGTDEGRAANRRTTFEWRASADAGRLTGGEG